MKIASLRYLAGTLALFLTVGACGATDLAQIEGLWLLDSVAVEGVFLDFGPDLSARNDLGVPAWFAFTEGGRFEGNGPCNAVSGDFEFDGTRLTTFDAFHTLAGCLSEGDSINRFEALVFDSLAGADVHFSTNERMQWQTDHVTLTFRRQT